jgi:hypothetical protein
MRKTQPCLLVVWGKYGFSFDLPSLLPMGAMSRLGRADQRVSSNPSLAESAAFFFDVSTVP